MRLLLLLLLLSFEAGAATWYVTATGAGSTNGTSLDNAYAGFADAWALPGDIDDGDTLCIVGTFTGAAQSQVGGGSPWMIRVLDGGVDGQPITLDGDCDGDGVRAKLDGADEVAVGIKMDTTAEMPKYINVRDLEITGMTSAGISAFRTAATDELVDQFHTYEGLWIHDSNIGFTSRGGSITLNDSIIEDVQDDAVFHRGADFWSDGLTTRRYSLGTDTGDGIQIAGGPADRWRITNYTSVDTRDKKQGLIVAGVTDGGDGGLLENFDITGVPGGTVSNGVYVTGTGTVVRRGIVRGFKRGVDIESSADADGVTVSSVISVGATESGFHVPVGAGADNSFTHVVASGAEDGIKIESTAAQSVQNSVAIGASGCGIDLAVGSATETFNDAHGNGTNFCAGGSSTAAGTGSISVDPQFIGGPNPTTAEGFKPNCLTSPLKDAGTDVGAYQDFTGRYFTGAREIGAYACQGGTPRPTPTARPEITARPDNTARPTADARP